MEVSSQRLAHVLHRHLAERGLLSFLSFLGAFFKLHVIKRNQVASQHGDSAEDDRTVRVASAGNDMRFLPEQPEQPEKIGIIQQKTAEFSG